jgi:predicted transcriptional regulator
MVRFSVDLPDEMAEALTRAAAELQSTPERVLAEVARGFLVEHVTSGTDDDAWASFVADRPAFEAWIAEGAADVAAGRTVPAEDVFAELDQIVAQALARKAE